jgi:hypothetical protein
MPPDRDTHLVGQAGRIPVRGDGHSEASFSPSARNANDMASRSEVHQCAAVDDGGIPPFCLYFRKILRSPAPAISIMARP